MSVASPNISGRALGNAASQMGGRLVLTALRFAIVLIVIKGAGVEAYGEFAWILSLILFSEVFVDFGMTDIVVRTLIQEPQRRAKLLGGVMAGKAVLVVAAGLVVVGAVNLLGYSASIRDGGIAALPAIACYGGVLLFRVGLKARLRMHLEVVAETLSVAAVVPLYLYLARPGTSLSVLVACHSLSRVFFLLVLSLAARNEVRGADFSGAAATARGVAALSYPIGLSLLVVCAYDALDMSVLTKCRPGAEPGWFAGSMRYVQLSVMVIYPVADTAFPMLAARWRESRESFREALRIAFRLVAFLAVGAFCMIFTSAEFLLHVMSRDMTPAIGLLRLLAFVALIRALMSLSQPLIIISGGMKHGLWITSVCILSKFVLLLWLVPRYGAMGAAIANLVGESLSAALVMIVLRRLMGFGLDWPVLLPATLIAGVAIGSVFAVGLKGTLAGGLLAGSIFTGLAVAVGVVPWAPLRELGRSAGRKLGWRKGFSTV